MYSPGGISTNFIPIELVHSTGAPRCAAQRSWCPRAAAASNGTTAIGTPSIGVPGGGAGSAFAARCQKNAPARTAHTPSAVTPATSARRRGVRAMRSISLPSSAADWYRSSGDSRIARCTTRSIRGSAATFRDGGV